MLLERGLYPGVETTVIPDESGVLDGGDGVEGVWGAYATAQNPFNLGRHPVRAENYRNLRVSAFAEWKAVVA